jgi:tetratricopeptide (TPR) repeat protein
LEENQLSQAAITAGAIAALKPSAVVLTDAGRLLLDARQYAPACDLLQKAAATAGTPAGVTLDLAIATLHATGAAEATLLLDGVPDAARTGSWYLAKADALDAMGKPLEAAQAMEQALRLSPREAGIYIQACAFLLRQGKAEDAMRISGRAMEALPENREVLLLRAVVLQHAKRFDEAGQLLEQVQNRWPEWPAGWLAGGIVLGARGRQDEARTALATALALGANGVLVKRYVDNLSTAAGKPADLTLLLPAQASREW